MLEHSIAITFTNIEYLVISWIYQSIDIIPEFFNDFITELLIYCKQIMILFQKVFYIKKFIDFLSFKIILVIACGNTLKPL